MGLTRSLQITRAVTASRYRAALVGLLLGILGALRLAGSPVPVAALAVLGPWAIAALLAMAAAPRLRSTAQADRTQTALYAADVAFLTLVHATLGGWWLGAGLYLLLVVFASISLPRPRARRIAALAILAFTSITIAQGAGAIPAPAFLGMPALAGNRELTAAVLLLGLFALGALVSGQFRFVRAMTRSREAYRLMFETVEDMSFTFDAEGRFIRINNATVRQTGYAREELHGQPFMPYLVPEDVPHALEHFAAALRGEPRQYEVRYLRKDGTVRWIWCTNTPIYEDGAVGGILAVVRDITERKLAAEAQEHALSLLRATLDSTADGILVVDLAGRIVSHNQRFQDMWAIPEAVLASREDEAAVAWVLDSVEDPEGFHRRVRDVYDDPEAEGWDVIRLRNGRIFVRYSRPQRVAGRTVGRVWSFRDVTEREMATAALRESEQSYRMLLDQSTDGVVLFDDEGRISRANPAFCQIMGAPEEEIVGLTLADAAAPGELDQAPVRFDMLRAGETVRRVRQLRRRDGTTLSAEIASKMLPTGQFFSLVRDVTERELLDERLRQAQKMEAVGLLAGGVAHDFNNLLTAISANAELALTTLSDQHPARADVEEIRGVTARATSLTRQLLTFSRKQPVRPVVLDVGSVVTELSKLLHRLIGEDIHVVLAPRPGLWSVRADPGQLEQALLNLAVNARDAMPDGGALVIGADNHTVSEPIAHAHGMVPPGEYVRLEVSDTGVGMPPEAQAHIFEPFFTTKERGKGTGLGLSTVYGIVKQHGGHIIVRSVPDDGTLFQILLPRTHAPSTARSDAARDETPESARAATILLVEDDRAVLEPVRRMLQHGGHRVLWSHTPQDALGIVEAHPGKIDLLLTDVVMPGMSGRELAELVDERRPGIAILFMSGYTDDTVLRRGLLGARQRLLQKPFTVEVLLRAVREALEQSA